MGRYEERGIELVGRLVNTDVVMRKVVLQRSGKAARIMMEPARTRIRQQRVRMQTERNTGVVRKQQGSKCQGLA